jgi:hypothetical protein
MKEPQARDGYLADRKPDDRAQRSTSVVPVS